MRLRPEDIVILEDSSDESDKSKEATDTTAATVEAAEVLDSSQSRESEEAFSSFDQDQIGHENRPKEKSVNGMELLSESLVERVGNAVIEFVDDEGAEGNSAGAERPIKQVRRAIKRPSQNNGTEEQKESGSGIPETKIAK